MANENKRQVDITYEFNYPRQSVFEAWTNPVYLPQWFAPEGCSIEFKQLDIKPGGKFHSCIRNPHFGDCWVIGEYKEIVVPDRLVFTMINADEHGSPIDPKTIGMDAEWPGETLVTVTFDETNGKTVVNLKQTVSEAIAKRTGAHPSWIQMLQRLEHLAHFKQLETRSQ